MTVESGPNEEGAESMGLRESQPGCLEIDTIVAKATASGPGAVAVIRMSGGKALEIVQRLVSRDINSIEDRVATLVLLRDPSDQQVQDKVLVTLFRRPNSYTGEDVAEFACHGGSFVPELVLQSCLNSGARKAEAGEFTRRAVLNGKLDLIQAEAILSLVESTSKAAHEAAVFQLEKGLTKAIEGVRKEIIELQASLASHIDFPEEDEGPVSLADIIEKAGHMRQVLTKLLETAPEGELLKEGAIVVLAGPPNSGKSSLYNKLLGQQRAIVSDIPGTTRDALEASISLEGFPFRIVDTAGIRPSPGALEQLGIEVAKGHLKKANLVLFCIEAQSEMGTEAKQFMQEVKGAPVVVVRTKTDLASPAEQGVSEELGVVTAATLWTSSKDNTGIPELRQLLPSLVYTGLVKSGVSVPLLLQERQRKATNEAKKCVEAFLADAGTGVPLEMACAQLQLAENYLEELTGTVALEEVLDALFASFCIGK